MEDRFSKGAPLDAYYFGVRFLDRVGYWDPRRRFWNPSFLPLPEAGTRAPSELARALAANFASLADTSERGDDVRAILSAASCLSQDAAVA